MKQQMKNGEELLHPVRSELITQLGCDQVYEEEEAAREERAIRVMQGGEF